MQTKIIKIFLMATTFVATMLTTSASTPEIIFKADSLFRESSYSEALKLYENQIDSSKEAVSPSALLKVAFIAERFGDIPKTIFYLSKYNHLFPSILISNKIVELASKEGYSGYQKNDFNNILLFIAAYYFYIIMAFVFIGLGMFYILFNKFSKNQSFLKRHSIILLIYFACLIFVVNFPLNITSVIVKSTSAELRAEPSSASKAVKNVRAGDKLQYLGKIDIWNRVNVDDEVYFINQSNCWEIK